MTEPKTLRETKADIQSRTKLAAQRTLDATNARTIYGGPHYTRAVLMPGGRIEYQRIEVGRPYGTVRK